VEVPGELDSFCRREHPRLVGALSLYCGDPSLAEEVAQEALSRACARWGRVGQMAAPGAWVHRVAINLVNSRFRRLAVERRARSRGVGALAESHVDPDGADTVAVRAAVAALPIRQRTALVLRYFADLPVADVADLLGVSDGAVHQLTHRAVDALRRSLGVDLEDAPPMEVPDAS
jgi:RNA polymerase sigma-70 factor (ECF subfamily)